MQTERIPLSRSRILIIDDEETVLKVIVKVLQHGGYDTIAFGDAAPALEVDLDDIDLIVTDLAMSTPGEDLIHAVRGRGFTGPIIVLTGVLEHKDMDHPMSIGADRVFQKPVRMAVLLSTLELLLSPDLGDAEDDGGGSRRETSV